MNTAFVAALLDPALPLPARLRAWNGSDLARRFSVHRNNVVGSLVDAVADTFPVVHALVGTEFFRAMAAVFVRAQPPRSPLMHQYGSAFPAFIEGFAPARPLPYLADVARLEFARVQACHAADAQPLTAQSADELLAAGVDLAALRPVLHPALRWIESAHPVVSLWAAHQGQGALEDVALGQDECALVVRPAFDVLVVPCDAGTVAFVQRAHAGGDLADCTAAGAAHPGFFLSSTLSVLLAHGALAALSFPEENLA
jgi:hypothetical protein